MKLPRFYPIFDSADWLERALPLGVRLVQLRLKDRPDAEIRDHLRRGIAMARDHGATLVVNDHWQAAIDLGADWLHLGQEDLEDADLPAIRRAGLRLGVSTHDHAELDRALALAPDYVALGPVWPTILKKMRWHEQGLGKVAEWRRLVGDLPLVAIGGLNTDRAADAFAAGADIVSAVTDITLNPDPEGRIRQWLRVTAQ
ncbi:thiamine phosphate synthase [Paracoccus sp. 1_MG-2023]|uniref:thiamine phosphate synthase n=1 Tax=unclassified Paracoccus (in: a-proteobacteria) TaxID=2688777 RepID=UPI001C091B4A|nr:thiamine phosphate synthase [Paracoccus sp. 1_MG-2023]MBU2956568.1 thiamine phosphate synthase [Paracoccus sp. C2R09]MDO6668674.1 thiamine phosphate synthase [Paracoccus sp. 1_MG-2023]